MGKNSFKVWQGKNNPESIQFLLEPYMYASGSLNFKKEQTNVYLKYSVTTIPLFMCIFTLSMHYL